MIYTLEFSEDAKKDIRKIQKSGDQALIKKLATLLLELETQPTTGTGKPEQLKHRDSATWSRRISSKHRLVYKILDDKVLILILSAYGHYTDK